MGQGQKWPYLFYFNSCDCCYELNRCADLYQIVSPCFLIDGSQIILIETQLQHFPKTSCYLVFPRIL